MLPEQVIHTLLGRLDTMLHGEGSRKARGPHFPLPGTDESEILKIDFPLCIEKQFPLEFSAAWTAIERTLAVIDDVDLTPLANRSPGLQTFNWREYLRCSVARMVRVLAALNHYCPRQGRVLDFGSYFGNTSLMCRLAGYHVDSVDSYGRYGEAFAPVRKQLAEAGARILDFEQVGYGFEQAERGCYDAVMCMGLVEHVPHTPRQVMETLDRLVKPGGILILDTPNLAYLYNRQKMLRGESTFLPLQLQYFTEIPFEGHHREYTVAEVKWMLEQLGHEDIRVETFLYSVYSLPYLQGRDLRNFRIMQQIPDTREYIMAVSKKPLDAKPRATGTDEPGTHSRAA